MIHQKKSYVICQLEMENLQAAVDDNATVTPSHAALFPTLCKL